MKIEDLDYALPPELIAQEPCVDRPSSRLLVCDRQTRRLEDRRFAEIEALIRPGDVLALNDTKVLPGRLLGKKEGTGGKVELLLLEPTEGGTPEIPVWRCLVQPALREGQTVVLGAGGETARYLGRDRENLAILSFEGVRDLGAFLETYGHIPLPPYIRREDRREDWERYQTVYAEKPGAAAAPTAGLHFSKELLGRLEAHGVRLVKITLHVGYGTFKTVTDLEHHVMHRERFEVSPETADAVNEARSRRNRVWAVGTTTLRALETCVQRKRVIPGKGETDLFIKPPFRFEAVDRLVTNFHLPRTSLLLLVSALMGEAFRQEAYRHAVAERYRFYSYGDAMAIL